MSQMELFLVVLVVLLLLLSLVSICVVKRKSEEALAFNERVVVKQSFAAQMCECVSRFPRIAQ